MESKRVMNSSLSLAEKQHFWHTKSEHEQEQPAHNPQQLHSYLIAGHLVSAKTYLG